ncbi:hypothetical protein KIN20_034181 [Parelaphostrongylus tenuis]|uniref:Uncharacterized protein n=1 Tax=Parelaphostrongylus tenuis TaxID=148309 RepID=A0AAD5WJI8_PARTN|nr:hypothetical protein KIN20_034181 [Parelaphostrongylus tenuis]
MERDHKEEKPKLAQLTSMRPVGNGGEAGYEDQYDATIGGVDISDVLPTSEDNNDYDRALGRFMRNEIDYDEFMRLTGGQTLEEELAADGGDECVDDEEDYEYGASDTSPGLVKKEHGGRADLPVHVRNLMQEIVDDELGTCRTDVAPSSISMETDDAKEAGTSAVAEPTAERERIPRKLSKTMDALLGHANVIYAKGNTQEALAVLLEVIRQEPRNAASYRQVSDIYQELGDAQKSLQYGLLAAHLDPRTPAEDWAHWGDESKKLELIEEAAACYGRAIRLDVKNGSITRVVSKCSTFLAFVLWQCVLVYKLHR